MDGGGHDLGTQIKWSGAQATGGSNAGGAIGGTIYFVAITAGEPAPTGVSFDQDANAIWVMADKDPDPDVEDLVVNRANGKLTTSSTTGLTGTTFTSFTANGTFDIYAVFVGTTGNQSAIPGAPQLASVVMN